MTQSKHTPLPLTYSVELPIPAFPKPHIAIFSGLNQTIIRSDYLSEENAAFIVKAVNNHEMLIEALQEISDLYIKKGDAGLRLAAAADIADDALADAKEEVAS